MGKEADVHKGLSSVLALLLSVCLLSNARA